MKSRRDAYLVIYISYFVIATAFLFDQSIGIAAYQLFAAVLVTAAMVGMNQMQNRVRPLASVGIATSLLLQAVPLMLVIFLLFPRVAPLWSIPLQSSSTTGLSDRLTPGDVANLTRSDELAFRVVFDGDIPAQPDLYWRGLVYSTFRDGTWQLAKRLPVNTSQQQPLDGLSYEVFLEASQTNWLFALDTPMDFSGRIQRLGDYRLINPEPVLSVLRYRVTSDPNFVMDQQLSDQLRERELQLPAKDNPRLRRYARELLRETGSVQQMIQAFLQQISENYIYTLSPPTLDKVNSIDQFWFETRQGFCTHYAGALVFALRSIGVPARMVGGYQGGKANPVTGHLVVRQYDAHAWVEAWLPGRGWLRIDPTASVAPERVRSGLSEALSEEDRQSLSFLTNSRIGGFLALSEALLWLDSIEHRWNAWVVGYDADRQSGLLQKLLGEVSPMSIGIALLGGGAASMLLASLVLFWRRRPRQRHAGERLFGRFCQSMARQGLPREMSETPIAYLRRLSRVTGVDTEEVSVLLQQVLYESTAHSRVDLQNLRQKLRTVRLRLAIRRPSIAS